MSEQTELWLAFGFVVYCYAGAFLLSIAETHRNTMTRSDVLWTFVISPIAIPLVVGFFVIEGTKALWKRLGPDTAVEREDL